MTTSPTVEDHLIALEKAQKEYELSLENVDKPPEPTEEEDAEQQVEEVEESEPEPPIDPYVKAIEYLEEHGILHLFQKLTSNIVFYRPEDPVQYVIDEVEIVADSLKTQKEDEKNKSK